MTSFQVPGCHGAEYTGDMMMYDLVKNDVSEKPAISANIGTRGGNTFKIARKLLSDQAASHI